MEMCIAPLFWKNSLNVKTVNVVTQIFDRFVGYVCLEISWCCSESILGLFTWSGGSRSSGVGFFCFHALGDTKQKKPTPLDRGPPLHVNRVLMKVSDIFIHIMKITNSNIQNFLLLTEVFAKHETLGS